MTKSVAFVAACRGARLTFFAAGLAIGGWASLIPSIKHNLVLGDAGFGSILLCLGLGSLCAMPATGILASKIGARQIIVIAGVLNSVLLPLLAIAPSPVLLGMTLLAFGFFLGALDVAINVHGSAVERVLEKPLMSGFHAMFSVGNLVGAASTTGMLGLGMPPATAGLVCAVIEMGVLLAARRLLLSEGKRPTERLTVPRGAVFVVAGLLGVVFLLEGAFLDWGGLLAIELGHATETTAGMAFSTFAAAMVVMRFFGDALSARFGSTLILFLGTAIAASGIAVIASSQIFVLLLTGCALSGMGLANMAPVLISTAGRLSPGAASVAVSSVATVGYAGHLMGPTVVGFIAQCRDLAFAFWLLAFLLMVTPFLYLAATRRG
ncbi:MFS transporter [Arenibacterium sp. LLYu02]|uniref:MFS transporter n=1 Tax=Arenibacterium sp. LLYu02 TaxID=3404132 RepID=UPI003B2206EC